LKPEHRHVEVAELPSGQRFRLTGNTRCGVWTRGLSNQIPDFVNADIYLVVDDDEMRELMQHFDSPEAAWKADDYTFAAFNQAFDDNWQPASKRIKKDISRPLRFAEAISKGQTTVPRMVAINAILNPWKRELMLLDSVLVEPPDDFIAQKKPFKSGIVAAWLLALRFESTKTLEFIKGALQNQGTKDEVGMDGIMAMSELFGFSSKKRNGTTDRELDYMEKTMRCLDAFYTNERIKSFGGSLVGAVKWYKDREKAHNKALALAAAKNRQVPEIKNPVDENSADVQSEDGFDRGGQQTFIFANETNMSRN
jgi:hypothetical protein